MWQSVFIGNNNNSIWYYRVLHNYALPQLLAALLSRCELAVSGQLSPLHSHSTLCSHTIVFCHARSTRFSTRSTHDENRAKTS